MDDERDTLTDLRHTSIGIFIVQGESEFFDFNIEAIISGVEYYGSNYSVVAGRIDGANAWIQFRRDEPELADRFLAGLDRNAVASEESLFALCVRDKYG